MRRGLTLALTLAVGLTALGQIRALLINQSGTLEESLRLLAVVRTLKATGFFSFRAVSDLPLVRWTEEPFQVIIHIPAQGPYIWFCHPWPESLLPEGFRLALKALREAFAQAFSSLREVRGPQDDLYPLLLTLSLASLGYLGGK